MKARACKWWKTTQSHVISLQWFPGRRGAVGSIVIAGNGFGATLWIPLQTLFVNPNNIPAVEVEGQEDRCLDHDRETSWSVILDSDLWFQIFCRWWGSWQSTLPFLTSRGNLGSHGASHATFHQRSYRGRDVRAWKCTAMLFPLLVDESYTVPFPKQVSSSKQLKELDDELTMKQQRTVSLTPKQALRTGIFWRLWILRVFWHNLYFINCSLLPLFQLSGFVLFFFFITYNKSYAMLYISDDTFLAAAATIQSVMNGSSRLIFGLLFDKYGFKVRFQSQLMLFMTENYCITEHLVHSEHVQCCSHFSVC